VQVFVYDGFYFFAARLPMRKPEALLLSSKANLRAKQLMAALDVSGAKRVYTLLLGENW